MAKVRSEAFLMVYVDPQSGQNLPAACYEGTIQEIELFRQQQAQQSQTALESWVILENPIILIKNQTPANANAAHPRVTEGQVYERILTENNVHSTVGGI